MGRASMMRCPNRPTMLRAQTGAGSEDYLFAKIDQMRFLDPEQGRERAMRQFLDERAYRPGLGNYKRDG